MKMLTSCKKPQAGHLCSGMVGLHGGGECGLYASVAQWQEVEEAVVAARRPADEPKAPPVDRARPLISRGERKELAGLEKKIERAEGELAELQEQIDSPELAAQADALQDLWQLKEAQQALLDAMYARWEELQEKLEADEERVRRARGGST